MTVAVRDIQGFVFDFDGVFYGYHQIGNIYSLSDRIMAKSAVEVLGDKILLSQAEKLASEGYKTYGDSITAFCVWAYQEGHDPNTFKETLFRTYHRNLREYFLNHHSDFFMNRIDLQEAFRLSQGRVVNGVATHGCAQSWAKPFLTDMGISQYFKMQAVHGLDEADYTLKHLDPRLVEMSFQNLAVNPSKGCFVEDTARNLKAMKERNPETRCTLIHHGRPLEQQPAYIDDQFSNIPELKRAYHARGLSERKMIHTLG
jgi:hypothetical protein